MSESSLKKSTDANIVVSDATEKQRLASDPSLSAWVGASAGSGKTKVLTDRILRLLLPRENGEAGTQPDKILAITFTKAGANEMAQRLSKRLSGWAVADDDKLAEDMRENLLGRTPSAEEIIEARKLFARVVDTPGGLKIMTIHSFCQSILGRFPIEAGIAPNFKPLEEEQAKELLDRARRDVLSSIALQAHTPLVRAIANIAAVMNETQFAEILGKLLAERHQMQTILQRHFGIEGVYTELCRQLGIKAGQNTQDLLADFASIDQTSLREAVRHLDGGKASDQESARTIQAFWDAPPEDRAALYGDYKSAFLTDKGTVRARLATKSVYENAPHVEQVLLDEATRIITYEDARKAVTCASLTRDLFSIGEAVLTRYQAHKTTLGVLDFDDLILRTLELLAGRCPNLQGENVTGWVMYKLDEGIEHILVDEAQDTNPEQWEIVRLLALEFFQGIGAKDMARTLFVVGDEKQSIFSFQRAAPEKFGAMRQWFEQKIKEAGERFESIDINTSFRSVQPVLDAVDKVYDGNAAMLGLSSAYLDHIAKRNGQAGLVEFWPLLRTLDADDDDTGDEQQLTLDGWTLPDRIIETQSGSSRMANRIGDTIKTWLDSGERLESYDRPIEAGDIMILVKSRTAIVGQIVSALKRRGVPVSGVDRMRLTEQIAVQDLIAAASFALLPEDDLTLASLLKSPLVGMGEDTLFKVAHGRTGSLWKSMRENGDSDIVSWLASLIEQAGSDHPYEFFSRLLQEPCPADRNGGLRAIRNRLGEDALDPLDEFLNSTLTYEGMHIAGLQGFVKWHTERSSDIKRELEEGGGAVRIMTVHGSKGLQAPIVFLPDTVHRKPKADPVLWPNRTKHTVPYYIPRKESSPSQVQAAQETIDRDAEAEYRRLLYVAMTRAEERLYVGGFTGRKQTAATNWYDDIRAAFGRLEGVQEVASGITNERGEDQPTLRLHTARTAAPDKAGKKTIAASDSPAQPLPDWARQAAPAEPFPPRPLAPSRPSEPEPPSFSPLNTGQDNRFKRGNITHRLMQLLPDLPAARRYEAGQAYLARAGLKLPEDLQRDILGEVIGILEHPDFAAIFGEGSMAEIPVTGFVDGDLISGQIDRLLVTDNEILIIDYKTNRPPPENEQDVPPVYRRQMTAYAQTLRKIYPDRDVRAALLWTDGARLMPLAV